jgi:hypothetical protein
MNAMTRAVLSAARSSVYPILPDFLDMRRGFSGLGGLGHLVGVGQCVMRRGEGKAVVVWLVGGK